MRLFEACNFLCLLSLLFNGIVRATFTEEQMIEANHYRANNTDIVCFNFAFFAPSSSAGSRVMRGYMIAKALSANPAICVHTMTAHRVRETDRLAKFLSQGNYVPVCVFVKNVLRGVMELCRRQNAFIFLDVIDSHQAVRDMKIHLLPPSGHFIPDYLLAVNATYLVQSTDLVNALVEKNVSAYYYPHQHTFPTNCTSSYISKASSPLVVGFLSGNSKHIPNLKEQVLPGICAVPNTVLHVINQHIDSSDLFPHYSEVNSSVYVYNCSLGENGNYNYHILNYTTSHRDSSDEFGQAAYYLDKGLSFADVGLVWTTKTTNVSDRFDSDMLRPPTRMLHWLSRGVPVIYFPTHSYVDIARLNGYEEGLGFELRAEDVGSLTAAVSRLQDVQVRELLSKRAKKIAAQYSVENIAKKLLEIIVAHAIACFCEKGSSVKTFVCNGETTNEERCRQMSSLSALSGDPGGTPSNAA
ncbi:hypothetical protein EON65_10195 [archaeon]|nr:MAG: hypothetical protein EON65_10195 [archaeon]